MGGRSGGGSSSVDLSSIDLRQLLNPISTLWSRRTVQRVGKTYVFHERQEGEGGGARRRSRRKWLAKKKARGIGSLTFIYIVNAYNCWPSIRQPDSVRLETIIS